MPSILSIPIIIGAAVLPALILIYYIYRRDTAKEPVPQLIAGFGFGVLSALVAIFFDGVIMGTGLPITGTPTTVIDALSTAFIGAGIPEELAKLLMLWLLLRNNRHFDQYFDGVVYAVSIGMGFAAIENVSYLFTNIDDWMNVAAMRAVISVPGHFSFAVLMGYFYSLIHIGGQNTVRNCVLVIAAPVLAHGAFDSVLFMSSLNPWLALLCMVMFVALCVWLIKECRRNIRILREYDSMPPLPPQLPPPLPPMPPQQFINNRY
jgi:RsiW-degrading membrane proteinase PrsW (M82 family)